MLRKFLPVGIVSFALCLGCNQTPPAEKADADAAEHDHDHEHGHDHDHEGHDHDHDHAHEGHEHGEETLPATYHDAVEYIETARDTIRDSLAADDKDKADAALHELGHTLEHIPELIKSHTAEEQEAIKKDLDELFELFGKLDEQIHGDLEVTYGEFSEKIDAAVERLHEKADHDHAEEK